MFEMVEDGAASRSTETAEPCKVRDTRARALDGRSQILIYLPPDLIRTLKHTAISEERPAYEAVEEAIQDYLKTSKAGKPRAKTKPKT